MVTKPKDTQHKIYININVYQTNSPPKLVTTKTFFLLTWSSSLKSITPHEEWHSILKILPLLDMIVKGHKRLKNLTGDRQKTDIEGMRRTRNHRPTRKRKIRCYGHNGKKKKIKTKKNEMHARVSQSIEEVSRIYQEEANLDGSRICQGYVKQTKSTRFWLDWSTYLSRSCRGQTQKSQ